MCICMSAGLGSTLITAPRRGVAGQKSDDGRNVPAQNRPVVIAVEFGPGANWCVAVAAATKQWSPSADHVIHRESADGGRTG